MFAQVAVYKGSVYAPRRNAVATNIKRQIVAGYRICHRDHRALACRVGEPVREAGSPRDGSHIQDDAAAARFHVTDASIDAVIKPLYVDPKHAVELSLGRIC